MADPRPLSATRMATARTCLRMYQYRYVLGVRPRTVSDAIRFGKLFHLGLETWWRSTGEPDQLERALDAMTSAANHSEDGADAFDQVRARELLIGYHVRWSCETFEVLGVEEEFSAPMVNPATGAPSKTWHLFGRLDARVKCDDGLVRVAEHKTTSEDIEAGSEWWQRLRMDGQATAYHIGARALGEAPAGILYDVIRKPTIRPYKATAIESRRYTKGKPCKVQHGTECPVCAVATERDPRPCHAEVACIFCDGTGWIETPRLQANQRAEDETPEQFAERLREDIANNPNAYYQRGEVVRLEEELLEGAADIWMIGQIIREAERMERWPRNPSACIRYGARCEYWAVCTRETTIDDPVRFVRDQEPALTGSTAL